MEEETMKEDIQPSTSKKDSQRTNSANDLYDDRGHDEGASNSETSVSATYSARSRVNMVEARQEAPKPTLGKQETKAPERKKKGRKGGRVEKRRKSFTRRQFRKAPMRKKAARHVRAEGRPEGRRREHSVSTIFTRLSSQSGSRSPTCAHCGHHCCRRRTKQFVVRFVSARKRNTCKRCRKCGRIHKKKIERKPAIKFITRRFTAFSKAIQTGSRSNMLSPLFIKTNSNPEEEAILPPQTYSAITPEMIFESLRALNLWKEEVQTVFILEHIRRNYPVNNVENELNEELREKLRIAAIVGIVIQTSEDCWSLASELEQRRLSANHVTLFWEAYADTLNPIPRPEKILQKDSTELPSDKTITPKFVDELV